MKESTKLKIRMKWNRAKRFVLDHAESLAALAVSATTCAAWGGYAHSRKLEKKMAETNRVVNHNAEILNQEHCRIQELQRQNALLLERALKDTEGEAE